MFSTHACNRTLPTTHAIPLCLPCTQSHPVPCMQSHSAHHACNITLPTTHAIPHCPPCMRSHTAHHACSITLPTMHAITLCLQCMQSPTVYRARTNRCTWTGSRALTDITFTVRSAKNQAKKGRIVAQLINCTSEVIYRFFYGSFWRRRNYIWTENERLRKGTGKT